MTVTLEQLFDGSVSDRNFQRLAQLVIDTGGRSITVRWGWVADDGTVLGGSGGFTVIKGTTGIYTVVQVMPSVPIVLLGVGGSGGAYGVKVGTAPSASGFGVITFATDTASNVDGEFYWLAVG